jgi:hypothetical protein
VNSRPLHLGFVAAAAASSLIASLAVQQGLAQAAGQPVTGDGAAPDQPVDPRPRAGRSEHGGSPAGRPTTRRQARAERAVTYGGWSPANPEQAVRRILRGPAEGTLLRLSTPLAEFPGHPMLLARMNIHPGNDDIEVWPVEESYEWMPATGTTAWYPPEQFGRILAAGTATVESRPLLDRLHFATFDDGTVRWLEAPHEPDALQDQLRRELIRKTSRRSGLPRWQRVALQDLLHELTEPRTTDRLIEMQQLLLRATNPGRWGTSLSWYPKHAADILQTLRLVDLDGLGTDQDFVVRGQEPAADGSSVTRAFLVQARPQTLPGRVLVRPAVFDGRTGRWVAERDSTRLPLTHAAFEEHLHSLFGSASLDLRYGLGPRTGPA